ncbi:MAG: hypothetical protein U1E52_17760 [Geminicoccaceae bacterium]
MLEISTVRPLLSATIWRIRRERAPPPMVSSSRTGSPVSSSIAA